MDLASEQLNNILFIEKEKITEENMAELIDRSLKKDDFAKKK